MRFASRFILGSARASRAHCGASPQCGFLKTSSRRRGRLRPHARRVRSPDMNAVIACGGTGGHLFPGLAVAEVLRGRGHEVMLFISEKEIDSLAVSTRNEFRLEKLPSIGLPSPFSPAILGFVRRFNESLSLCRTIYRTFKPNLVLGMGGFTSTAPVMAARFRGVPSFHS